MSLGCHYYVLSLGLETSLLFEAFRDDLIDVENQGFPVVGSPGPQSPEQLRELAGNVDRCLAHYHEPDPLGLVVVGCPELQSAFAAVTTHGEALVGRILGGHTTASRRDLGQIVWPVVKEAISGVGTQAMRDLADAAAAGQAVGGLESVAGRVRNGTPGTLLVEDDYCVRGGIRGDGRTPAFTSAVDVREALDDVIDAVIEKTLACGGRVVFTPGGTLADWERIAFLPESGELQ